VTNCVVVGKQWQSQMKDFCTELMWLFNVEVFIIEIFLNEPAVNQNSTAFE
jgi:hypothetical protein